MITSPSTGVNNQSWDYVTHFTTVNAWIPKNMTFVNTKIMNKLDDDTKAVIMAAAANAEKEGWALGRKLAKEHTDILAEKGIKVAAPTETLTNELKAIGATMLTEWLEESGDDGKALIEAYKK
jgi:TRAP-type C4-dicarboxylate transport system substrate-binding protein